MRRRTLLTALPAGLVAAQASALLAGCGFKLRQAPVLPFQRIQLGGFGPRSPLADELARELSQSATVVQANGQPEVVLLAITDRRDRAIVAATAAGQLREVQLKVHFEFRLTTAAGRELIPPTGILLARDMSYSETFALAKEQEESLLYAAMQSEIVMQVLRRLASIPKV
jgi:LPS-assembly lipoprotein